MQLKGRWEGINFGGVRI